MRRAGNVTSMEEGKCVKDFVGKKKRLGIDGKMTLNWTLKREDGRG
jgi:hypothetical protein